MPVAPPNADTRWRCTACGNLTRFDVVRTQRVREFLHADLAGDPVVEESETLSNVIEHVTCRWCNAVDQVELVSRPATAEPATAPTSVAATAPTTGPTSVAATATAGAPAELAPAEPAP